MIDLRQSARVWMAAIALTAILSVVATAYFLGAFAGGREKLVVSTTTSLYDTLLLDRLEEQFEAKHPLDVYFISVGTGLAIEFAQRGDADMILVHSPSKELAFLEGGYGVCRKIIAYNFFIIVGPQLDPAEIGGLSVKEALNKTAEAGRDTVNPAKWVSRGDDSGTHTKEKALWASAGHDWTEIRDESWYVEAGAGMGDTLLMAEQISAYTLADVGTYLKYTKDGLIDLEVLVGEGKDLLNVYSAIACNNTRFPKVNFDGAITFIKYLTSDEGQQIIEEYGKSTYGEGLFHPTVRLLRENTDPTLVGWIKDYAYFDGYECPPKYWDGHPELYG